jgi:hypothetical protein
MENMIITFGGIYMADIGSVAHTTLQFADWCCKKQYGMTLREHDWKP